MFQKIKLLLFAFCSTGFVFGQDLSGDMAKITKEMDSLSSVSIKVKVEVYGRKGGSKIYSTNASIQRDKNSSLNILAEQENFESPKYQVSVDHEEKSILILKKQAKDTKKKEKLDPSDIRQLQKLLSVDQFENKKKSITKLVSNESGIKKYSVTNLNDLKEIQITVDMNRLSIQRITYQYSEESENKGQYIVLDYTEFDTHKNLSDVLTTSRYFTLEKGKYILKPTYKNYKLYTEL